MNLMYHLKKCIKRIIATVITLAIFSSASNAQTVANQEDLNLAISNATAGSTIILSNGNYESLDITIAKNGTTEKPITIKAESIGGVILSGASYITIGGSYIYIDGFTFKKLYTDTDEPIGTGDGAIQMTYDSINASHCKLTNLTFDGYDQADPTSDDNLKWIRVYGQYHEIANCSFLNRVSTGSCIGVQHEDGIENFHNIHHNFFAFRRPVDGVFNKYNDQDAIRIGNSWSSLTDASIEIHDNYFYDFQGELEIISSKCGNNKFYNNTFQKCTGILTLRHGEGSEVYNNFFFGEELNYSGGVRIIDGDHRIHNNYFEGLRSGNSSYFGAINVFMGDNEFSDSDPDTYNMYGPAEDILIAYNTIVNCDKGIRLGPDLSTREIQPSNIEVVNNMMVSCTDALETGTLTPSGTNIYSSNIREGGTWWDNLNDGSNKIATSLLSNGDSYFEIAENSPAIEYAVDLTNFTIDNIDLTGGLRGEGTKDAGAQEYGISAGTNRPWTIEDVGFEVGVLNGINTYIYVDKTEVAVGGYGENFTIEIRSNTGWTITEDMDWLEVSTLSGVGDTTLIITVAASDVGDVRRGEILIETDQGSVTIHIEQEAAGSGFQKHTFTQDDVSCRFSTETGSEPHMVIDGDLNTMWKSTNQYDRIIFELDPDFTVQNVKIAFYKGDERSTDFAISETDDPSVVDNDLGIFFSSGISNDLETFEVTSTTLNYLVLQSFGISELNSTSVDYTEIGYFTEIEIWGEYSGETSIETNTSELSIYPQPTSDKLTVSGWPTDEIVSIKLYNQAGQLVLNKESTFTNGKLDLDLSELSNTQHFFVLSVQGEKNVINRKIIIK